MPSPAHADSEREEAALFILDRPEQPERNAGKSCGFLQEVLDIWPHLKLESRAGEFCQKLFSIFSFLLFFCLWREKGSRDVSSGLVQTLSASTFLFKYTIVFCFREFTVW